MPPSTAWRALRQLAESGHARLFTGERRADFMDFLRRACPRRRGAPYADAFLSSRAAPSHSCWPSPPQEIRDREQFVLLDEQQLAYKLVLHATEARARGDHEDGIIVTGARQRQERHRPVAARRTRPQGRTVLHATGSRSFTQTLRKVAGPGSARTQRLFKYFNNFVDAERNGLDVLILRRGPPDPGDVGQPVHQGRPCAPGGPRWTS